MWHKAERCWIDKPQGVDSASNVDPGGDESHQSWREKPSEGIAELQD
jgi:hypothetical protein